MINNKKIAKTPEFKRANLTPLIDVVLQLLIFFMLVNQFENIKVDLMLVEASQAKPILASPERIEINVTADGVYHVLNRSYSLDRLTRKILKPALSVHLKAFIRGDKNVDYMYIQNLMLTLSNLNISNLYIIAKYNEEGF